MHAQESTGALTLAFWLFCHQNQRQMAQPMPVAD
jgi:hypothetical protein